MNQEWVAGSGGTACAEAGGAPPAVCRRLRVPWSRPADSFSARELSAAGSVSERNLRAQQEIREILFRGGALRTSS